MRKKSFIEFLCLATILLGIIACSEKKLTQPFIHTINVKGELFIPSDSLKDPRFINIIDTHLIIGNYKGSPLVELYDIKTGNREARFLTIGNGPFEFLCLGNVQPVSKRKEIYISDLFIRKLVKYNLSDILDKPNTPYKEIFEVPKDSELLISKIGKVQNGIVAESMDPKGRIVMLDANGSVLSYFGQYPNKDLVDPNLTEVLNAKLYASAITINPSMNKVALATYQAGMIDLFDLSENGVDPVWSYQEFYPEGIKVLPMAGEFVVAHTDDGRNGFLGICSTDKYVYSVYSGKKFGVRGDNSYTYGDIVYVVSWDGRESFKFQLNQPVIRLVVDSEDEIMYGLTAEHDIYKFVI